MELKYDRYMERVHMIVRKKQHAVVFLRLILAACLVLFTAFGCATDETGTDTGMLADTDESSTAEGAAYTADSMHFRKEMPKRSSNTPLDFYYKHCTEMNEASFYSKTSYDCSGPY